jgi:PAS domain S-box-containing protein
MSVEADARVRALEARVAMLEHQLGRRRPGTYDRDEFLVRAFEDAPIGMALVGVDERILEANASLCAMLGYSHGELLRKTVPDITHPDDRLVEAQPKGEMKTGEALSFVVEKRYLRADGTVLTGRLSVTALYDEQLKPAYFLGQLEDVTRERAAEAARLTREAQFRTLFDHAPDALVVIDSGGVVQSINGPARRLWPDLSPGDLPPTVLQQSTTELLAGDSLPPPSAPFDLRIASADGVFEGEVRVAPLRLPDGRGLLVAIRDVTERRRAERALEAALADISRTLAEREVLLKEVHHRVKNNLQIVSSLLGMQADRATGATQAALTDSVRRVRSMGLIHQMLYSDGDLSKIELGQYARSLVAQLRSSLGAAALVEVEADRVEVSVDKAIPCGLILNELVTNALKHGRSADGTCRLQVHVRGDAKAFAMTVADQGPGLPADFESRERKSLGLQVIRALVRQLGAHLSHRSGDGAAFTLEVGGRAGR